MKCKIWLICFILILVNLVSGYSRSQASRYADRWWNKRNSFFNNYTAQGGDCANYVSQCCIAGGLQFMNGPGVDDKHAIYWCPYLNTNFINSQSATVTQLYYPNSGDPPSRPAGWETGDAAIFGTSSTEYNHAAIVKSGIENNCRLNAHDRDTFNLPITYWWGTGGTQRRYANTYEIPDNAGGLPDLYPFTPTGWAGAIVVSSVPNTHTQGPNIRVGKPIYIDWAITNSGNYNIDIPDTVKLRLYIDNTPKIDFVWRGQWYNNLAYYEDFCCTLYTSGSHTVKIQADHISYWVELYENNNEATYTVYATGVEESNTMNIPLSYRLAENNPNPFSHFTTISYQLPKETEIALIIYDKSGRKVKTLIQEKKRLGYYKAIWDGKDEFDNKVANGVYFVKLQTKDFGDVKKIVLLK